MINTSNICVFDFETGGKNPKTCEPLQIACVMLDPRTYDIIPGSEFNSYMKPLDFNNLEDEALKINNITIEMLEEAPEQGHVWELFKNHVNRYKVKGFKMTSKPIACGHNIDNFDMTIVDRLCQKYGPYKETQTLFHYITIDTMKLLWPWFENTDDLPNYRLDPTIRNFFGMSNENAHDALADVRVCAELVQRFMLLHRKLYKKVKFQDKQ